MNCYVCAKDSMTNPSVALCKKCGVAMCLKHSEEADTYTVGGMNYGCPHSPAKAKAN